MAERAAAAGMASPLRLEDFDISPVTGFLSSTPPLARLPGPYFDPWEDLMSKLPLHNQHKDLRPAIHQLPEREFNDTTLSSEDEWKRAYVILCFIGQSYIWGEGQESLVDVVPKKIAIPWCHVSEHLKLKPVISYSSTALYNFHLTNPEGKLESSNIDITSTFTGTKDEEWFYKVTLFAELTAGPGLRAMCQVFTEMAQNHYKNISDCLQVIAHTLDDMTKALGRMYEACNPMVFYTKIRPFQAGSEGLDVFREGLYFEGVDAEPRRYNGASAGQAAVIHAFDVFFGTEHFGTGKDFLVTMRTHMPVKHQEFLEKLGSMPPIREYCKSSGDPDLIKSYNTAVDKLVKFRCDHVILVVRFIVNQQKHSINPALNAKGSGGTDFMIFLKNVRNSTKELLIEQELQTH